MPRLREHFNADVHGRNYPTEFQTEINRFLLPCGLCGKEYYVDEQTHHNFKLAIAEDFDNPFVCPECDEEFDELAHS